MKHIVSRLDYGHYECYVDGYLFTIMKVEPSVVSFNSKGNVQSWLMKLKDHKHEWWADTKKSAVQIALNHIHKLKQKSVCTHSKNGQRAKKTA